MLKGPHLGVQTQSFLLYQVIDINTFNMPDEVKHYALFLEKFRKPC